MKTYKQHLKIFLKNAFKTSNKLKKSPPPPPPLHQKKQKTSEPEEKNKEKKRWMWGALSFSNIMKRFCSINGAMKTMT